MRLSKLVIVLFIVNILLIGIAFVFKYKNVVLIDEKINFEVTIDSLKAENKLMSSQLAYVTKYYDSTTKKISQSNGFAFISDSVINAKK